VPQQPLEALPVEVRAVIAHELGHPCPACQARDRRDAREALRLVADLRARFDAAARRDAEGRAVRRWRSASRSAIRRSRSPRTRHSSARTTRTGNLYEAVAEIM
jgi:predicted Zn-dependent protease